MSVEFRIEGWNPVKRRYETHWTGSEARAEIQFSKPYYPHPRRLLKITTTVEVLKRTPEKRVKS